MFFNLASHVCCCSLAGTEACKKCPNNIDNIYKDLKPAEKPVEITITTHPEYEIYDWIEDYCWKKSTCEE